MKQKRDIAEEKKQNLIGDRYIIDRIFNIVFTSDSIYYKRGKIYRESSETTKRREEKKRKRKG